MKLRLVVYIFCILTYNACKNTSSVTPRITLQPSEIIQDSLFTQIPGALILCNHHLIWEDPFNPDYFLHVVDINNRKKIASMGLIGRGPKEFITPSSIHSTGNKIFTYDLNQDKQAYYSIDSLLLNKDPFIPLSSRSLKNCLNIVQIKENEFISLQSEGEYPFQWIHPDTSTSYFGNSPIKEKLNDYYDIRQGILKYNPAKKKLLYSTNRLAYIALYEKCGNIFELQWEKISKEKPYSIEKGDIHFTDSPKVPSDIAMTKDYIILLQQDEKTVLPPVQQKGGIRDFSQLPTTVLVYDYDFHLKKIINMDMPILRIAANNESNTLYAIGINLDFCIVKYEL